jgi:hypothetical protein
VTSAKADLSALVTGQRFGFQNVLKLKNLTQTASVIGASPSDHWLVAKTWNAKRQKNDEQEEGFSTFNDSNGILRGIEGIQAGKDGELWR